MLWVALALVGVGGALVESTGAEAPRKLIDADYVGEGHFDRSMKIEFRIREKRDRELVRFEASNVSFACDDNTTYERRDLPTLRAQLAGKTFERVAWDNFDTREVIIWFRGRLIDKGRRAKGFVRATFNPPQQEEDAGGAECTTAGRRSWVARRIESR
jgi:hypothetical protein